MHPELRKLPTYRLSVRQPRAGQQVILTVDDGLRFGPYPLPFPCIFDGEGFANANTGTPITLTVIAWRPVNVLDRNPPRRPGRLTCKTMETRA